MKEFVKMTLAVICGFVVVNVVLFIFGIGFITALVSSSESTPIIPKSGVMVLDMSKFTLAEQSQESNPIEAIRGNGEVSVIGIWDAVQALKAAAEDPAVKYIYLKADGISSSIALNEEFREALSDFRQNSGKAIVAYTETPSTSGYYLASVADKIYMSPYIGATSMFTGVGAQMLFLGDLLNELGVNVQLIRHGKYKSAGETFVRGSSSKENLEQNQRMVDALWESMSGEIAKSRNISVSELNACIDELKLCLPQDWVDCKLVDELYGREEIKQKLADLAMCNSYKDLSLFSFADYVSAKTSLVAKVKDKSKIAIIYTNGEIVDGNAKSNVSGDRFASIISKVRADSTIKAVVLRVNSPGGSVVASEKIKAEINKFEGIKPIVASYGDYAASGGYWISCGCDKIFSDRTTLTGSIGVFSMVPELSKVAKKIHVGLETVSSNKHGDMYGLMRPFDSDELAYMQKSIEAVYDKFTTIVSEGRSIERDTVDEIGQGRVWAGADALGIKLIDEIGTLEDAVRYAAMLAGDENISNWSIASYPKPQTQIETVLELLGQSSDKEEVLLAKLKEYSSPKTLARMDMNYIIR